MESFPASSGRQATGLSPQARSVMSTALLNALKQSRVVYPGLGSDQREYIDLGMQWVHDSHLINAS